MEVSALIGHTEIRQTVEIADDEPNIVVCFWKPQPPSLADTRLVFYKHPEEEYDLLYFPRIGEPKNLHIFPGSFVCPPDTLPQATLRYMGQRLVANHFVHVFICEIAYERMKFIFTQKGAQILSYHEAIINDRAFMADADFLVPLLCPMS